MLNTDAMFMWLADQGLDPEYQEDDTEVVVPCPECQDDKPRLYIGADSGAFICFHCGWQGNLVTLVKGFARDFDEAYELVRTWQSADHVDPFAIRIKAPDIKAAQVSLPAEFRPLDARAPEHFRKYLERRGIGLELAQARGIGYCLTGRYSYRVVVPVVNDGFLYGYMARTIFARCPTCGLRIKGTGGVECVCARPIPKVLQPNGGHPRLAVYNLDAVRLAGRGRLVVMEGWGDALRLPYEAVAILGSSPSATQISLLAGVGAGRDVIVCLDGDDAGRAGAVKVADGLASAMIPVRIATVPDGKDPGKLGKEELAVTLETARRYIL